MTIHKILVPNYSPTTLKSCIVRFIQTFWLSNFCNIATELKIPLKTRCFLLLQTRWTTTVEDISRSKLAWSCGDPVYDDKVHYPEWLSSGTIGCLCWWTRWCNSKEKIVAEPSIFNLYQCWYATTTPLSFFFPAFNSKFSNVSLTLDVW